MQRPTSISVISILLIVFGFLGLLGQLFMMFSTTEEMRQAMQEVSSLPFEVQVAQGLVGSVVTIVCGFGLRAGANWARVLYVVFMVLGIVISFATSELTLALAPSVLFTALIIFFLYRPAANAFFSGARASDADPTRG